MQSFTQLWSPVLVNKSNRPVLEGEEAVILVQNHVGLYQGKAKILGRQNGRVYLTNKRIIYLDNEASEKSMAMSFDHVLRVEPVDRFLRSSPKVKVFLCKPSNLENIIPANSPSSLQTQWVCRICSYVNFAGPDQAPVMKCSACGVDNMWQDRKTQADLPSQEAAPARDDQCPTCTFINHPMLKNCEMCGAELSLRSVLPSLLLKLRQISLDLENRTEEYTENEPYIKLSFRDGGSGDFARELSTALEKFKWERLQRVGAVNKDGKLLEPAQESKKDVSFFGIHGLEQRGERQRHQNDELLSTSLLDFEQLMLKYLDLLRLTDALAGDATSTVLAPSLSSNHSMFAQLQELARQISEYLVSERFYKPSSMITAQGLFASYNRFLVASYGYGTPLLDPTGFTKALDALNAMDLPVVLRKYANSGLVIVAYRNTSREIAQDYILEFLRSYEQEFYRKKFTVELSGVADAPTIQRYRHFSGCTASQIAESLEWSFDIAAEEIQVCVETGSLVLDQSLSGTFYFKSFTQEDYEISEAEQQQIKQNVLLQISAEQQGIADTITEQFNQECPLVELDKSNGGSLPLLKPTLQPAQNLTALFEDLKGLEFS